MTFNIDLLGILAFSQSGLYDPLELFQSTVWKGQVEEYNPVKFLGLEIVSLLLHGTTCHCCQSVLKVYYLMLCTLQWDLLLGVDFVSWPFCVCLQQKVIAFVLKKPLFQEALPCLPDVLDSFDKNRIRFEVLGLLTSAWTVNTGCWSGVWTR